MAFSILNLTMATSGLAILVLQQVFRRAKLYLWKVCSRLTPVLIFLENARRAGSDGSMSASGSAGPGFDPRRGRVVNFHLKIFNSGARRGGDVHFLIARLYITVLD